MTRRAISESAYGTGWTVQLWHDGSRYRLDAVSDRPWSTPVELDDYTLNEAVFEHTSGCYVYDGIDETDADGAAQAWLDDLKSIDVASDGTVVSCHNG